jgi:HEAT repeat protein
MRAVEALGQIGQRSDLQQLARMRSGEHWVVRASIYSAIAKLGRPLDLPLLQQGLTDRNPVVQRYAIVAIYDLIGCESVTILKPPFGKNKNAATRPAYINVFAKCGDTQALAELKKMAHSDDMRIAGYAQEALSGMFAEWNVC